MSGVDPSGSGSGSDIIEFKLTTSTVAPVIQFKSGKQSPGKKGKKAKAASNNNPVSAIEALGKMTATGNNGKAGKATKTSDSGKVPKGRIAVAASLAKLAKVVENKHQKEKLPVANAGPGKAHSPEVMRLAAAAEHNEKQSRSSAAMGIVAGAVFVVAFAAAMLLKSRPYRIYGEQTRIIEGECGNRYESINPQHYA
jgi:hypothetical protein